MPYSRNAIQPTIQLYGAIHAPRLVPPPSRRHTAIQTHTALYEHTAIQHHTLYSPYNTPQTRTTRAGFVSASATASDIDPSRSPWRCARCSCAVAVVDDLVDETRATRPGRRHGCAGSPQAGGSARKRVGGPPEALERRSGINSTRVRAEAFRKGVFVKGVCSRISAALSCDTVKTRFSGSGGAGRSPARRFYGQALFSRQNLHAIRPTAPRWIALIETCTKHAKQGECGAARGLQERTCLRNAVATAMDARSCGSSRPDAKHSSSTAALVQYACTRKTRTAPPCSHAGQGRCALQ